MSGVRAVRMLGIWATLSMSGVGRGAGAGGAGGALAAQTDTNAARDSTRQALEALLTTYEPAQDMRFGRSRSEPYDLVGSWDKPLQFVSRLDVKVSVTRDRTIGFRVYPRWRGARINLRRVRQRSQFMKHVLRDADQSFFHWALDPDLNLFAGFTFTLESGFPTAAIQVVVRSIPLLDRPFGELVPFIE